MIKRVAAIHWKVATVQYKHLAYDTMATKYSLHDLYFLTSIATKYRNASHTVIQQSNNSGLTRA